MSLSPKALSGVVVLDLTQFFAGPVCTLSLGMMGAEVLKVERPEVGEQGRNDNHRYVYGEQNLKWAICHSNKKSITLNLKSDEGKKLLARLVEKADVLVENYAPGTIERLGFDYEKIQKINPRCIFCQIKGYSDASPYRNFPAMDGPVQATAALASQTGLAGSPPVISSVALADAPAGDYALIGILAALYQREQTGRGQHVRINMQEVVLAYSRASFTDQVNPPRRGDMMTFSGKQAPRNMYPCKPRFEGDENNYVFLMVRDTPGQKMWKSFCEVIGRMDLFEDPRFANGPMRFEHVDALDEEVKKWTTARDKEEVMTLLCQKMIPAGAVMTIPDICRAPDMFESGFLQKYDHPRLGEITLPTSAVHMSDSPVEITASPDLGQDNDEIYKGLLGLCPEDYEELKANGVI